MKNNNCGKRNHTKPSKPSTDEAIKPSPDNSIYNAELEYYMSESEKIRQIDILLNKFLHDTIENLLITEFESADIRFMINDYLTNHGSPFLPDFSLPGEDEINDDF